MSALMATLGLILGATSAGPIIDEAAAALRRDPVFVHPQAQAGARGISADQADRIRAAIRAGDDPIFVAVLPTSAEQEAGGLNALASAVGQATGIRGTYAVITDRGFRAGSNALPQGAAGDLATDVFNDHRGEGAAAVVLAFVERVQSAQGATGGDGRDGSSRGTDGGGGGTGLLPVVLIGGAVAGGIYLMRKNRRQQVEQAQLVEGDKEDLRADLAVLADDVMRLESEVSLKPEARDDYEAGVARFRWAEAAIDAIDSPDDIPRVRRGMSEAHYAMARARAIIRGHEPPPPPPELQQPGPQGEPAVYLDDRRQPVYAGYERDGYDRGWGGGGFFGGNGLFTGLLLGQMLGGGGGFGWGGGGHDHGDQDRGGWSGGDAGGGDWGGDSGGGDFGGGDSGGGDW